MTATAIYGKMGSNKSHFSLFYGLLLANKFKKKYLVANFPLHPEYLLKYCLGMGYYWNVNNLKIVYVDLESGGMDYILSFDDAIIIFDESALYTTARGSASVSTKNSKFHKELTQIRHRKNYLLTIAQNPQQIDSAIKNLCEEIVFCNGITMYSEELKTQKLYYRNVHLFIPENFEVWYANPRLRRNPIKSKILSKKWFGGFLKICDSYLFNVYSSFALVHEAGKSVYFCDSELQYTSTMQSDGFLIYQFSLSKVFSLTRDLPAVSGKVFKVSKYQYMPKLKEWAFQNLSNDLYKIILIIQKKYHISIYDIIEEAIERKLITFFILMFFFFTISIFIKCPLLFFFLCLGLFTHKRRKKKNVFTPRKYPVIWHPQVLDNKAS